MDRNFFMRKADKVACELLGKILVVKNRGKMKRAKIVETEAYFDENDPASRARQNGNLRETMLMEGGTILVYGVHNSWLLNIVTGIVGEAAAVLIRAVEPLDYEGRGNGPGLLTESLEIGKWLHREKLGDVLDIVDGVEVEEIVRDFRIGVTEDLKEKMRFYIYGNKYVSKVKKDDK